MHGFNCKIHKKNERKINIITLQVLIILSKIMRKKASIYRNLIDNNQEWNNQNLNFDPDSSPIAWKHYKNYFKELQNEPLSLSFSKSVYRLTSVITINGTEIKVGGDCSFNFNDDKINKMNNIIKNDKDADKSIKKNFYKKLKYCAEMHHTLLNFDLIPVTGGMNNVKGNLKYKNDIVMYHDAGRKPMECLDRFDTFIYFLNKTFINRNKLLNMNQSNLRMCGEYFSNSIFTASMKTENFCNLYDFLLSFSDIYDYCDVMYSISDRRFIKEIIQSGSKKITSIYSLGNYLDLANKYWDFKESYFKNYKIN